MPIALVDALYNDDTIAQWEHDRTMQHSSGIWGRKPMLDYLRDQVLRTGDVVVDLGAGAGYPSFRISEIVGRSGAVIGIELSEAMVAAARRRYTAKHLSFETGNVTKGLPLPTASADAVTSFMLLHNLKRAQLRPVFAEVNRILKASGIAILLTMHPDAFESDWDLSFLSYDEDALARYRDTLDPEDLEIPGRALNAAGGENAIVTIYHTRVSMLRAAHDAGLSLVAERDLWIDALSAVNLFGPSSVRRLPQAPIYWMLVLRKARSA
jgi:SAM-dependent methyltransferase